MNKIVTINPRAVIGDNNPPGAIELAEPTIESLRQFLKDNPVIVDEGEACEAKALLDRVALSLKGIEDERKSKVDPLNAEVKAINVEYHQWHNMDARRPGRWNKLLEILRNRLSDWAWKEEAARRTAAEAARKAAEEAERIAREAEAREREAAEDARQGVCDVDIAEATQEADEAFQAFQKADRKAQRAERDSRIRIGGGWGRAATLKDRETLTVADWRAAVDEMSGDDGSIPQNIVDAILTAARAYRRACGDLPAGVSQTFERSL